MRKHLRRGLCVSLFLVAAAVRAGHPGTDLFLPVVGRSTGASGQGYFTDLWITNVSDGIARVQLEFLRNEVSNPSPSPLTHSFSLGPEESRAFNNVTESVFRVQGLGGMRIRSNAAVAVTTRLYSQHRDEPPAASLAMTYAAVPAEFAVATGQTTFLQGVTQSPDFRYNISLVETTGNRIDLRMVLRDRRGGVVGRYDFALRGYEQRNTNIPVLFQNAVVEDGVLVVRGQRGTGRAVLVGSLVATRTTDSSAFEMTLPQRSAPAVSPGTIAVAFIVLTGLAALALVILRRKRPWGVGLWPTSR